jgi:hypothetical protein
MEERRDAYRVLVGKREERRPLGRPRRRWKDNIKMYLRQIGWEAWTESIRIKTGTGGVCCEYGDESSGSIKCA